MLYFTHVPCYFSHAVIDIELFASFFFWYWNAEDPSYFACGTKRNPCGPELILLPEDYLLGYQKVSVHVAEGEKQPVFLPSFDACEPQWQLVWQDIPTVATVTILVLKTASYESNQGYHCNPSLLHVISEVIDLTGELTTVTLLNEDYP